MAEGIQVEIENGFARIQFLDREKAGEAIGKLIAVGGPGLMDVDTRSGRRKVYIVPESVARDAGLVDETAPEDQPDVDTELDSGPEGDPSESWTIAQLKDYAAREEINLGGAERKADILAAIRAANQPVSETPAQE